ncbi:MAG TPA: hypothetical protein VGL53_11395 [Bryobacteraceae bacterium]|jgi:hypothetical protein
MARPPQGPGGELIAERAMAMSWAFEGNCKKTAEYETRVMGYWKTQENDAPATPFISKEKWRTTPRSCASTMGNSDTAYDDGHAHCFEPQLPKINPKQRRKTGRSEERAKGALPSSAWESLCDSNISTASTTVYTQARPTEDQAERCMECHPCSRLFNLRRTTLDPRSIQCDPPPGTLPGDEKWETVELVSNVFG